MPRDRLIHRLPSHRFADFDDILWPVNAALVVFGLCVAGVVVAESDFHTPVLVYNGWVRLGSLMGLLPCGLVYAALLKSLAPADPLAGAVSMAAFGLGTAGPLFLLGAFSSYLARPLARYGSTLTAASVTAMGLFLVIRGLMPVTMAVHVHPQ